MTVRADYQTQQDFTWQPYRIKPVAVWAMRMNVEFECRSLQGVLRGNAGDWIVRADDGWTYPVPHEIFRRLYVKREWRKANEDPKENGGSQNQPQGRQNHDVDAFHVW